MFDLIVGNSFDKYAKGDRLSGDDDLLSAIAQKYPHNVVRVARGAADLATHVLTKPAPAAAPAASTK